MLAHLLREQRQFDIRLVFVAVADDDGVGLLVDGYHGVQLRLATRFQTDVELLSVAHYLVYHRLHLVDLDGIHQEALPLVAVFFRSMFVALVHAFNTVLNDVGEA